MCLVMSEAWAALEKDARSGTCVYKDLIEWEEMSEWLLFQKEESISFVVEKVMGDTPMRGEFVAFVPLF